MLIYQNNHLKQVTTGNTAVHQFIAGLEAHTEVNAISVNEYLLARDHANYA